MHLGWMKGAAGHFPQATSENTLPLGHRAQPNCSCEHRAEHPSDWVVQAMPWKLQVTYR